VVELEYHRISLAAVHAWMQGKVFPDTEVVLIVSSIAHDPHVGDVPIAVAEIPEALVFNETGLAPGVTNAELRIAEAELINRLLNAASAACLGFR
jgi:hypothetical protein